MKETDIDMADAGQVAGSTLSFHDLYYSVNVKDPTRICGTVRKDVLKGISGIFKPGMNAIMGPTASGKTSLLDVLAGRKERTRDLTGEVLINGKKQRHNFKNMSGYVVQNDIVMSTMTVKENLMFSANLRLPGVIPAKEKKRRVEEAIEELGLTECQNTRVGGVLTRGVSGGERKRTNIGMELVVSSNLLFLDEPTTGLDANTAYTLMALLRGLTRSGRTIIFAIHQPRYSIFKLFDGLMLIDAGRTVYHGPAGEALKFFTDIGYECEPHDNPADFFLDVISGIHNGSRMLNESPVESFEMSVEGKETTEHNGIGSRTSTKEHRSKLLADQFEKSHWYKEGLKETLQYLRKTDTKSSEDDLGQRSTYARAFPVQVMYVCKRTLINLYRFPLAALIQWSVLVVFALVTGAVYFNMKSDFPAGVQNRIGAFFFLSINMIFACTAALELFINERVIFLHEQVSGYYRVSAYFVAKVFCDIIPMRVIPMIPVCLITYFMFGLDQDIYKVLFFMLTLVQASCCGAALCFLVSGRIKSIGLATLVTYLVFVVMMVYGGTLVNIKDIASWIRWPQYLSIVGYSVKALTINEMKGMEFCGPVSIAGLEINYCYPGTSWLRLQGMAYDTPWDLWKNQLGLFLIFVGLLLLTYIQLRRMKKSS